MARAFEQSGVLLGVPLQTAQEAVNLTGVGFVHSEEDGRALDPVPYWGTRRSPQGRSGLVRVETRNGLVSDAISWTRN